MGVGGCRHDHGRRDRPGAGSDRSLRDLPEELHGGQDIRADRCWPRGIAWRVAYCTRRLPGWP
eukprot:475425-Pyramimonas_sp.AAC.1